VLITHDLGVVAENAEHVVVMYAGRVVESAPASELFASPRHPYTRGLLESRPQAHARVAPGKRLPTIEGMVPDLRHLPPGCRFAARCGTRVAACSAREPELATVAPGRWSRCIRWEAVS